MLDPSISFDSISVAGDNESSIGAPLQPVLQTNVTWANIESYPMCLSANELKSNIIEIIMKFIADKNNQPITELYSHNVPPNCYYEFGSH